MLLDIGIGILSGIFVSDLFQTELTVGLILFAIVSALLPDIDTLFHLQSGRSLKNHKGHDHRDLWHYPLIYIPLGTLIVSLFSYEYALVFAVTSFLHFLHDSIGIGWGVQWLYPFSTKHFSFLYHYDVFRNKLPKSWIYSWSHQEVDELSEKYGDRDWVRNIYLRWHPYGIVEMLVFIVSVIMLYFKLGI